MISSVVVTGILKDKQNEVFRIVETNSTDAFHPEQAIISEIPVMFWTRDKSNPLMNASEGKFVVIKGRLESHPKLGLYVLCESLHITKEGDK